jgi:RIO-like serine/threonine protein kinase
VKFILCRDVIRKGDRWIAFSGKNMNLDNFQCVESQKELNRSAYSSIVEYDKSKKLSLKLIKPQTNPRDTLRKYFLSQAKREFTASLKLQSIGIATPAVFGYAFSISPLSRYESILFMEYKEGMVNGFEFLADTYDSELRKVFLKKVVGDINTMYNNRLHHRDCNFGNILVGEDMSLLWIDNDLKIIRNKRELQKYFGETVKRLERAYKRSLLTDEEWEFFSKVQL